MIRRTAKRVARKILATGIASLCILSIAPRVDAFTAAAGVIQAGNNLAPPVGGGQFTTLDIQTFAGLPAFQLSKTENTANLNGNTIKLVGGTFTVGADTFGPDIWSTWDPAAGVTKIPKPPARAWLLTSNPGCLSWGDFMPVAGGAPQLSARASRSGPAGGIRRAGAQVIDPFRVPVGTYSMEPIIGGMHDYVIDDDLNTQNLPTSLKVDEYGETATIEFFADDNNDTSPNPIWSFGITMDATKSTPSLIPTFSYDPMRLSFSGDPEDWPTGESLLADLLTDTANVDLDNPGTLGMELKIFNPVTLFQATYTAASSSQPYVDFSYGLMAGGVEKLAGDFNGDDIVDAADYVVWRKGLVDSSFTQADLQLWRSNFGNSASAGGGSSSAVPEPSMLCLLPVGIGFLAMQFRRMSPLAAGNLSFA
jgi:hypothetical protein